MRRRELKLRECPTDMGNHHKTPGFVFSQQVLRKRDFSDSLWAKFGLCRKGLKLTEYATDSEGNIKQVSCFRQLSNKSSFRKAHKGQNSLCIKLRECPTDMKIIIKHLV